VAQLPSVLGGEVNLVARSVEGERDRLVRAVRKLSKQTLLTSAKLEPTADEDSWREHALCKGATNLFYPLRGQSTLRGLGR
jgi:hypothetical protein